MTQYQTNTTVGLKIKNPLKKQNHFFFQRLSWPIEQLILGIGSLLPSPQENHEKIQNNFQFYTHKLVFLSLIAAFLSRLAP